MLPRIRLLQIGDIHLPEACKSRTSLDAKDPRFPADLQRVLADAPIKTVFRQIYALIADGHVDGVVFMGDLTDYGSLPGYQACAMYISRSLQIGSEGVYRDLPVGVLPGNHDVDRKLAKGVGISAKFLPLQQSLTKAGLPQFAMQTPNFLQIASGTASASIALLNSCWGCGSEEYIPEEFRESVSKAIEEAIGSGSSEKAAHAYYNRQLDTPAYADQTIQSLAHLTLDQAGSDLLVVCAHHNLLPQRQPRLAPYTELVNSGAVRDTLTDLRRPVLYLHGHIHDDPVELLTKPDGDPLVCISAPLVTDGFNLLELVFTRTGAPLSCHLAKWRLDNAGAIRRRSAMILPLLGHRRRSHDRVLSKIYAYLLDEREVYWDALLTKAAELYSAETEVQLIEALELLTMDGRVKIDNYEMPEKNWIIGASL